MHLNQIKHNKQLYVTVFFKLILRSSLNPSIASFSKTQKPTLFYIKLIVFLSFLIVLVSAILFSIEKRNQLKQMFLNNKKVFTILEQTRL